MSNCNQIAIAQSNSHPSGYMNLDTAIKKIQLALFDADAKYERVVFDEWFIVSLVGLEQAVLHYSGPRYGHNYKTFTEDIRPLANQLIEHKHRIGNVDFAPDGIGPGFDAMITLGTGFYAILNDTRGSTTELQENNRWAAVEEDLIGLGDKFRSDPLLVTD